MVSIASVDEYAQHAVMICLLGSFRIFKAGQPITLRHAGKTRAFLACLALEARHTRSREDLLQSLWPDTQWTQACQALNSLVYSLRRMLSGNHPAPIEYVDGYYRLNTEVGVAIDFARFEALAHEGQQLERHGQITPAIECYKRAIELYRGDLCVVSDTRALVMCEALRANYLNLLARLADHYFTADDHLKSLAYAQRLLAIDPCREDAHRVVMRCYDRQGQRAQALRHYQLCAQILQTEFEAAPEPATQALYDQIRSAERRP